MLRGYLRRHIKTIVLFLCCSVLFMAVFALYNLPVEAVVYAVLLCLCVGALFFIAGYRLYLRRHRALQRLLKTARLSLDELPAPRGLLDEDYQAIIEALFENASRTQTKADAEKTDTLDLFTLWAHQIKTPLSALKLICDQPEAQAELFKLEQYVEMALQALRLDDKPNDIVLHRHALDDLLRQSLRKYARLFIASRNRLDFTPTNLTVLTDEKWLCFIFEQIVSNALKYTSAGVIRVYTEGETLVVADSGIGIREEDQPRVFEKGYTGYNGRADKKATGLGLYLSKKACEKLGHGLSLRSSPGKGTSVSIDLHMHELEVE